MADERLSPLQPLLDLGEMPAVIGVSATVSHLTSFGLIRHAMSCEAGEMSAVRMEEKSVRS